MARAQFGKLDFFLPLLLRQDRQLFVQIRLAAAKQRDFIVDNLLACGCDFLRELDFLGAGQWLLHWWHDAADSGDNAEHLETTERTVTATDTLDLRLAAAGGAVARFTRVKP